MSGTFDVGEELPGLGAVGVEHGEGFYVVRPGIAEVVGHRVHAHGEGLLGSYHGADFLGDVGVAVAGAVDVEGGAGVGVWVGVGVRIWVGSG